MDKDFYKDPLSETSMYSKLILPIKLIAGSLKFIKEINYSIEINNCINVIIFKIDTLCVYYINIE